MLFLVAPGVASGQKTDSVWIRNGDRITGEVKSLSRGLLKYSTADLGTCTRVESSTVGWVMGLPARWYWGWIRCPWLKP
jgi:hypothetical protein